MVLIRLYEGQEGWWPNNQSQNISDRLKNQLHFKNSSLSLPAHSKTEDRWLCQLAPEAVAQVLCSVAWGDCATTLGDSGAWPYLLLPLPVQPVWHEWGEPFPLFPWAHLKCFSPGGTGGLSQGLQWPSHLDTARLPCPKQNLWMTSAHKSKCGQLLFQWAASVLHLMGFSESIQRSQGVKHRYNSFSLNRLGICGQGSATMLKSHSSRNVTLFTC